MNDNERQFENFIRGIKFDDTPDPKHRDKLEQDLLAAIQKQPRQKPFKIWRIIMRTKIAKLATAATIILAVVLTVFVLDRTTTPAWSIEQTIEALKNIKAVYIAGYVHYSPGEADRIVEMWGRPHSQDHSISGDFRYHEGDHHLAIASEEENTTYVYTRLPQQGVVYITEGLNRHCYTFPTGDLLAEFKSIAENWKEEYRKDPETGRDSVFVTFVGPTVNTAKYWLMQFDIETKLLVHAGVWWDKNRQGKPHFNYTKLEYDPEIPDDFFKFEVPENTQVIDCRELRNVLERDPNCGITIGELSTYDACKKVAQEYWHAVTQDNWPKVRKIRPLAVGKTWDELLAVYKEKTPVELVGIPKMNHLDDPGTFAEVTCVIKVKDGKNAESVLNVEIKQTPSRRIGVVAGSVGPEFDNTD